MKMENNKNKSSRRCWTSEETKAFLDAYSKRQFEFQNTKLKKFAMANVLEDLIALGILSQPTTEEMLHVKLKNLLRAFKATSDSNKRTGESASKAPFEEQMEEIFGTQPVIRNSHTINLSGKVINALPMPVTTKDILSEAESNFALLDAPSVSNSPATSSTGQRKSTKTRRQKRVELKQKTAAEKNKILAEYTANKLKKMDEAEKGREVRFLKKEALLRELLKK